MLIWMKYPAWSIVSVSGAVSTMRAPEASMGQLLPRTWYLGCAVQSMRNRQTMYPECDEPRGPFRRDHDPRARVGTAVPLAAAARRARGVPRLLRDRGPSAAAAGTECPRRSVDARLHAGAASLLSRTDTGGRCELDDARGPRRGDRRQPGLHRGRAAPRRRRRRGG